MQVSSDSAPMIYNSCAWSSDNCQVVSENAIVGNVHCIKLQQIVDNHCETCWVDPNRDYVVVFWERRIADRPARSVAIEYRLDAQHVWLPSRWTCRVAGRDAQQSATLEATVTQYTLNETFHEYPFAKSYPPGTQVFDVTADVTSERRVRGIPNRPAGYNSKTIVPRSMPLPPLGAQAGQISVVQIQLEADVGEVRHEHARAVCRRRAVCDDLSKRGSQASPVRSRSERACLSG